VDLQLAGKVALLVGASTGLGKALALRLAREQAHLAVCDGSESEVARVAAGIERDTGNRPLVFHADVTESAAVERLVRETIEKYDSLDVLVINSSEMCMEMVANHTPEDDETAVRLMLMSAVRLCYAALPAMKAQGGGSILIITPVFLAPPPPNAGLSHSLRLSIVGLIKTLADEIEPSGVRVNGICPGWARTARVDLLLRDRARRKVATPEEETARTRINLPLDHASTPDEFAAAAATLLSSTASSVTGICLLIDGGVYRGIM
jgi:3-oxoacyl-[acyl-carrier protein] reductase